MSARPTGKGKGKERPGAKALFRQLPRTFGLVLQSDGKSFGVVVGTTLLGALVPAAMAYVAKLIVDSVVRAQQGGDRTEVLRWVGVELGLVAAQLALSRLSSYARDVLRANLGNIINERILEKSLTLELKHFEDSETYDRLQNARREASSRPLSLALSALSLLRGVVTLVSLVAVLAHVAWWTVLVLLAASLPGFLAEAKLSGEAYKLYSWRAPEGRRLNYLEWILTRDSHVKEVKLYGLGDWLLNRYRELFGKFFVEDRKLARKRALVGFAFGLLSTAGFYLCYAATAAKAASSELTVGDLALALAVFRQAQGALESILGALASAFEDALFMSNLFAFLELPTAGDSTHLAAPRALPAGAQRLELDHVSFRYPGKDAWALKDVTLTLEAGQTLGLVGENGAGKSTLIKLLLRLYEPTEGTIRYGGVDIREVDVTELRARFSAVFQDYVRYQFSARDNIALSDVRKREDEQAVRRAADAGGATEVIEGLPDRFETVLGGWFEKGTELSAGQWQKLAVARAFLREAEVMILDEPTASIDAEAEAALFERFQQLARGKSAIIISHRFSTVRMADRIAVLEGGKLTELGSHGELVARKGRYARLFELQARGYA